MNAYLWQIGVLLVNCSALLGWLYWQIRQEEKWPPMEDEQ